MLMKDNRFYMTSGSRWVVKAGLYGDYIRYPRGAEFVLHSYDDRARKLAIHCPAHTHYFECISDARRYERHNIVTGTINYSRVKSFQIELLEPARGRVYFIRVGNDRFFTPADSLVTQSSPWSGGSPVFMQELPAWKMLIMDAAKVMRARSRADDLHLDDFSVCAFDPITESEYRLDLPEWKHRLLRWMARGLEASLSRTQMGSLVMCILKATEPFTIGEVGADNRPAWSNANDVEKRLGNKVRAAGKYLFFQTEEDAVMAKMTVEQEINLFSV